MPEAVRTPCQWIEVVSVIRFVTAIVTVWPSRQRSSGPGTETVDRGCLTWGASEIDRDFLDSELKVVAGEDRRAARASHRD
jgi:hypothetical protein